MFGRKFHLFLVGILTLMSLSLSLIADIPKALGKAPEVVVRFTIDALDWPIVLTDRHLLFLRVEGILIIVLITILVQYKQVYRPFLKFEELRRGAFDHVFGSEIDKLHKNLAPDLRFNIMQQSTYLKFSRHVQIGRLRQVYHYGYRNEDRDKALRFWYVKIFGYVRGEGVSATAFITERAMIADLRDPALGQARLRGWKLAMTSEIKLVMSFPIFRWSGDRYRCAGTMNVDICNPGVVEELFADESLRRLTKLAQYFQDWTEYVSLWL